MEGTRILLNILVAAEIFSVALLGITVNLTIITKLTKNRCCITAISVLSAINLFMIPVVIHLLCIYRMQFLNESVETTDAMTLPHAIPCLIICILNPLVLKLSAGIIAKVKKQLQSQDSGNVIPTDIKKEGDV